MGTSNAAKTAVDSRRVISYPVRPRSGSRAGFAAPRWTDGEGRIKLNRDGTLSVAWWLRDEDGEWKPWMNNTFTRIQA